MVALVPCGPVAQWLEQRTHNPLVGGSSPSGPTIFAVIPRASPMLRFPRELAVGVENKEQQRQCGQDPDSRSHLLEFACHQLADGI